MALIVEDLAKQYSVTVEKITELIAKIQEVAPGESDDFYETAVALKLKKNAASGPRLSSIDYAKENAKEFKAIVLGISKVKDDNDFTKRAAWKAYRTNKHEAVTTGQVEVIDGDDGKEHVIPLDNKKYFDKEKTKENPDFGKPIPYEGVREMLVAMDNKLYIARGPVSIYKRKEKLDEAGKPVLDANGKPEIFYEAPKEMVKVGFKSQFWGGLTAVEGKPHAGVIRVWREAYSDEMGKFDDTWAVADALLPLNDLFKELSEVGELPGWGYFVTHGYVAECIDSEDGKKKFVSVGDKGEGKTVRASTSYEPLMLDADELVEGDEVYMIAERSSYSAKNEAGEVEWRKFNQLMGIIKNPATCKMSAALAKLAAMGI